ncbi:glycine/betaine/sarcosine/D-proline reductase family selenoprotein B [Enterococcus villorum]|uniref:Glycine/betaine/sarcosine/D-proline reductase family selenoprotein B n=1 Tax=Enterococcus villorum TaxID=112904 RepID=A0A1V8YWI7_9ENTE|nr:GrdB-related putative oxidoreductase [Enterococcus villorum]OQO70221.1 glycine/betaine/sarcosine/D-proline reductase family selenoprotein B [Enterococcus villorum]OQO76951.1 glycine/betaine/sarcosine/D-proline reductase family selenoprotein B [Enterococcus villorum]
MKKIILILNHVMAGMGSDEQAQLPPGGKKVAMGPGETLAPLFKEKKATIIATLYCGDRYYLDHPEEVKQKFIGFAKKFEADAVLCGPAMHYPYFGEMAGKLAQEFQQAGIPAVAAMSIENPAVEEYRTFIPIIKMPKKGGIGLNQSYKNMVECVTILANGQTLDVMENDLLF